MTTDRPAPTGRSIRADLGEGLGYARKSPTIVGVLFLGTLPGVFIHRPHVRNHRPHGRRRAPGLRPLCGHPHWLLRGWRAPRLAADDAPADPAAGAHALRITHLGGAIYALYSLGEMLPLSMALLLLWGLGGALFLNLTVSLIHEACAPEMMGRVMSMHSLAFTISTPAGYLQAGIVASLWGPQAELVASGLVIAVAGLFCVAFLSPVRRLL